MTVVDKKVNLELIGLDGNAFAVMGAFQRQAKAEKWSQPEIDSVLTEAQLGNYEHLLATIMDHCTTGGFSAIEDEEDDDECMDCGMDYFYCEC